MKIVNPVILGSKKECRNGNCQSNTNCEEHSYINCIEHGVRMATSAVILWYGILLDILDIWEKWIGSVLFRNPMAVLHCMGWTWISGLLMVLQSGPHNHQVISK